MICLFFVIVLINGWKTRQVDFVLVYPQVPLEYDTCTDLSKRVESKFGADKVLWLNKNLYGHKKSGRQFHIFARENLISVGWEQLYINDCVIYKEMTVMMMYVDDLILMNEVNDIINDEIGGEHN